LQGGNKFPDGGFSVNNRKENVEYRSEGQGVNRGDANWGTVNGSATYSIEQSPS